MWDTVTTVENLKRTGNVMKDRHKIERRNNSRTAQPSDNWSRTWKSHSTK